MVYLFGLEVGSVDDMFCVDCVFFGYNLLVVFDLMEFEYVVVFDYFSVVFFGGGGIGVDGVCGVYIVFMVGLYVI